MPNLKFTQCAVVAGLLLATPAFAEPQTFATFTPVTAGKNVRFVNSGSGNPSQASDGISGQLYSISDSAATTKGLADTRFSFLQGALANFVTGLPALFELDATVTNTPSSVYGPSPDNFYVQTNVNGFFEFTTANAVTVFNTVYDAGTVLLRGDFTLAAITGQRGASSGGFGDTLSGTLSYTSPFLNFANPTDGDFQMSFNSIASALFVAGDGSVGDPYRALRSFKATASGNFGSDPLPAISAVPEPETWGLMLVGFAMIGFQSRRRSRPTIVAS